MLVRAKNCIGNRENNRVNLPDLNDITCIRGGEWSFKKCVPRKILAKFQGSRRPEFFFDAFSESRFLLQG